MPERGLDSSWVPLATKFPVTIVKDSSPEVLKDGESPNAKGLGIDEPGYLYYDSTPTAGSAWLPRATISEPTNAPKNSAAGAMTWNYFHNRVWGWSTQSGDTLYILYGAFGYYSRFMYHGLGKLFADEETGAIKGIAPFGKNLAILKESYFYMIDNAADPGNDFVVRYVGQNPGATKYEHVVDIDGTLVVCNTYGVWATDGNGVKELTAGIRNNLGAFRPYADDTTGINYLRADFNKRWVVGSNDSSGDTVRWILDLTNGGLYDYSSSGFLYTTPTFVAEGREPLLVTEIGFAYKLGSGSSGSITYSVQVNDTWNSQGAHKILIDDSNGWASFPIELPKACRRFALKITDIDTDLRISGIYARVKQGGLKGYAGK